MTDFPLLEKIEEIRKEIETLKIDMAKVCTKIDNITKEMATLQASIADVKKRAMDANPTTKDWITIIAILFAAIIGGLIGKII
ncbi:hypothetical protein B6U67_00840 [Methanosarcinales archaeon ex4484_138]|nr:MAG: hypothetical protein B6U67_00840 [Methanosarcinales archaeon ex4484_138]